MRGALIPVLLSPVLVLQVLVCLLSPAVLAQTPAPPRRPAPAPPVKEAPPPVIGCPSLANLRRLLRDAKDDRAAALAVLAAEHADHLGCAPVPRERVVGLADHVALGGQSYDCLGLRDTGLCHWTLAGAISPPEPQAASHRAAPSARPTPDKARR